MTSYLAVVRHCDYMSTETLAFSSNIKKLREFLRLKKIRLSKMENFVVTKKAYVDGLNVVGIYVLSEKQVKRLNLSFQHCPEYWFLYIIATEHGSCQDLKTSFLELGQSEYWREEYSESE